MIWREVSGSDVELADWEHDFLWVELGSGERVIAYLTVIHDRSGRGERRFQYAETTGDREGLSIEYHDDVVRWAPILEPTDQPAIEETRTAYVVWVIQGYRPDGSEARMIYEVHWSELQALKTAHSCTDAIGQLGSRIESVAAFRIGGHWYAPSEIREPTPEGEAIGMRIKARRAAIERAKAAGLTDEEIELLGAKL